MKQLFDDGWPRLRVDSAAFGGSQIKQVSEGMAHSVLRFVVDEIEVAADTGEIFEGQLR